MKSIHPREYAPHRTGDGKRFHVRTYNGGLYQVYGCGLEHICECGRADVADMIADALEAIADKCTCPVIDGVLVTGSACRVHGLPEVEWVRMRPAFESPPHKEGFVDVVLTAADPYVDANAIRATG